MRAAALEQRRPGRGAHADVYAALSRVIDPELDQDVVELGFVAGVERDGARVSVKLRLPTYWCAPNFSWLMVSDAREALLGVPGIEAAEVTLIDHHATTEISAGVNSELSFEQSFPDHADGELCDLRTLFRRKAFLVRQGRAVAPLERERLSEATLSDLSATPATAAYLEVRGELGLDCSPSTPVLTDAAGRPVRDIEDHLRRVRMIGVSLEGNSAMCRGLLQTRYGKAND